MAIGDGLSNFARRTPQLQNSQVYKETPAFHTQHTNIREHDETLHFPFHNDAYFVQRTCNPASVAYIGQHTACKHARNYT